MAVEEQSAVTREISNNAQQTASGTDEVSQGFNRVSQSAEDAEVAVAQVLSAAGDLSRQSESLRTETERFIAKVRAG